ncbi:alpha-amylase family glycosyl hydrolase [Flavobacterium terrae]|uniref:Glycosidase n=1 Tax=Flavobacterium terrae TaxID=415425 RepID=A0A1M6BJK4_9FLAO|nr:alpha-amylase family glycosyl hydrolase [Flavobacterium terrae]SHI48876.1 Glycosidase [Flavobacterium terrae]
MKKIVFSALVLTSLVSCKKEQEAKTETSKLDIEAVSQSLVDNAIIYEANIRQYSPEGTFNAFTRDIPKLKKLGVKVLWLMPIHEIGYKNRKAKGDVSIEQITDSIEKQKYLGSHYSVKDYRSINSNYGTKEDFQKLVKTAHQNGIYVILDWVANHTAWDHPWVTMHNDYYTHDKDGKMIAPFDWTDVAELDYKNPNLRKAMIDDMKYWIKEFNIDGFRCDVAAEVPTDFWENATVELNKIKPVFMLAEAEKPELMKKAFDMQYAWEGHHILNGIAQGKKTVKDFDTYIEKISKTLQPDDIYMNFTSNHDENSWNGTEYERMGDAVETFAALTYTMPGMPLIYNGQEYDLNKRLRFFEKDTIPHSVGHMMTVYEKLGKLKVENPALKGGKNPASYRRIQTSLDDKILAFERENEGKKVIYIANLTKDNQNVKIQTEGNYKDYMNNQEMVLVKDQQLELKPWQYIILAN